MEIDFRAPFTADNTSCNGYLIAATIALQFTSTIHLILGRIRSTNSILMKLLRRRLNMASVSAWWFAYLIIFRVFVGYLPPLYPCMHASTWPGRMCLLCTVIPHNSHRHSFPNCASASFVCHCQLWRFAFRCNCRFMAIYNRSICMHGCWMLPFALSIHPFASKHQRWIQSESSVGHVPSPAPAKPRMERGNGWTFTFKIFQAGIKVLHSVHVRPEWVDGQSMYMHTLPALPCRATLSIYL